MNRINLLAIYSEEITFLYNFFLSTLLSNHAATAKVAVRGGWAAIGQAGGQKHRKRAGGGEATWWSDSGGSGARVKRQSGPDFEGERPGGECGGAEVRQGGSRAGSVAGSCGGSGAEWAERRLSRT
jgi:hypothetical protein